MNAGLRRAVSDLTLDKLILQEAARGELLSSARRCRCVEQVRGKLGVSERRACAAPGQHRSTQRRTPRGGDDEEQLTEDIIALAREYGRYGHRKIAERLRLAGWVVNDRRVERMWRREGLKVPSKQPKRRRLWLGDGSCIRLRAEHRNHVWSYAYVEDRTDDGRKYRMLNIVDEFTRECLAIRVARRVRSIDVIELLAEWFLVRAVPGYIRSDNGPEFVAKAVHGWPPRWAPKPCTSPLAALGRTATSRASTHAFATNCSTGRSSSASRRPGSLSKAGGAVTTRCVLTGRCDTAPQRPRSRRLDSPLGPDARPVACGPVGSPAPPSCLRESRRSTDEDSGHA